MPQNCSSHYIYLIKGEIPEITHCPLEMEFLKDKCRHKVYLYTIEFLMEKKREILLCTLILLTFLHLTSH